MNSLIGQTIKDYELTHRIGAGGFGIVYQAMQKHIDREVAIKVILPEYANQPDFIRRFEAEAQIVARLEHPHITPLYDYWRDPNGAYFVMRYLRGGSVLDKINDTGPLSVHHTARIITQIASALDLAHRNHVIHRDLKPANILLDEDSNAYLADFGIAKNLGDMNGIDTGSDRMVGSLDYISPEQARGEDVTPYTDIYAFGILVYEMLTGKHPYGDVAPVQRLVKHMNAPLPDILLFDDDLNYEINVILDKATAKLPENRYETILDFANALLKALGAKQSPKSSDITDQLTQRDMQLLTFLANGLSDREIAMQLTITIASVKWNLRQLFQKLGVRSRNEAIIFAQGIASNIVALDDQATDERSATSLMALPEPQNPYKGLLAFQSGDANLFYGREDAIERIIARIREDVPFYRFLAIVGPSGSGKSSLVKAGLIPSLWDGKITSSENWFVAEMLPSNAPFENLEIALKRVATKLPDYFTETLTQSEAGLATIVDAILPDDDSQIVLVIDQFEELFTQVTNESVRQRFLDSLRYAITSDDSRVYIYVTLRADYYDKPLQYTKFGNILRARMETVLPLDLNELQRAIEKPAEQVGVAFEEGLVAQILQEMNMQVGALPLLQYALTELFDRRKGRLLTIRAYQEIGGAVGALAKRAENIYQQMQTPQKILTRQMFLRLVTLGEGSEDTRRRVTQDELRSLTENPDVIEDLIDTYTTYRLLSSDHDPDTRLPIVEVAHEAILREWKRLRQWLDTSRDDIRQERLLAGSADEWFNANKDESYLLSGSRLESVESWLDSSTVQLTAIESDFVTASQIYRNQLQREEMARIEREEILEQRSRTILTALVIVFAIATLVGIVLSTFSIQFANEADANFQRAERIRLAAQAQISVDDTDSAIVSALLSLRSFQIGYSPEADSTLLTSMSAGFPEFTFDNHSTTITSIATSPDGRLLATASRDDRVQIWNIENGDLVRTLDHHENDVTGVMFSSDSRRIITSSLDQTVSVRIISSGRETLTITHDSGVRSVAIAPDGQTIVTTDSSNNILLWNSSDGTLIRSLSGHDSSVNHVIFSPDSRLIGAGSLDASATLWDVETGDLLWQMVDQHSLCVCHIAFSPNGDFLLATSFDGTASVWDITDQELVTTLRGHTDAILQGEFSSDGEVIVTSSDDRTTRFWDVETGAELRRLTGFDDGVSAVTYAVDNNMIFTGTFAGIVQAWRTNIEPEPLVFRYPLNNGRNSIVLAEMLPDGRILLMADDNGDLIYWSIGRGITLRTTTTSIPSPINDMAITLQGNTLFTVDNQANVLLSDVRSDDVRFPFLGHRGAVYDIDLTDDGTLAITGGEDNTVRVWDIANRQEILQIGGHTAPIRAVAVTANNQFVVTGSDDNTVRMWDIDIAASIHRLTGHTGTVNSVAFSPDSTLILSGSDDRTARLWSAETGDLLNVYEGHADAVLSVAFSTDGTQILTGSADGSARLWDLETGDVQRNLVGHAGAVEGVSMSPDGTLIITHDSTAAFIWHTHLDDMIAIVCDQLPRDFTDQERNFFNIDDNNPTCPITES